MARMNWRHGLLAVAVAGCGAAPLGQVGDGASRWIGEPTVTTTSIVTTTLPTVIDAALLQWFNDGIVSRNPDDPAALRTEIFGRRGGDLFVQSSRSEVVTLVPEVRFPTVAPYLAQYVTSQLVFDTSGALSADPTVAFGIWSSEPYTRSRSIAQMVVLRVSTDPETASELEEPGADVSCGRFAERATQACSTFPVGDRPGWRLQASNGNTIVWFEGVYRYELFGRTFVAVEILERMAEATRPLSELVPIRG